MASSNESTRRAAASWLRRLTFLTAGAAAGIGIALWLIPEENEGDEDEGLFVQDVFLKRRSDADFDFDDADDEDFRRRRHRHRPPTFASKPLHPPRPPTFLAQLTVRGFVFAWFWD
jgi:hypothetical protein